MTTFLVVVICAFVFGLLSIVLWRKARPTMNVNLIVILTITLVVGLLILIGSGRLHWLAGIIAAVFPFLRRALGFFGMFSNLNQMFSSFGGKFSPFNTTSTSQASAGGTSETETSELKMVLNHDTNELTGRVLQGQFTGQALDVLSGSDLIDLYAGFSEDASKRLLLTYLNRYHPDLQIDQQYEDAVKESPGMDVAKACAILGVSENATKDEINEAYKRLIQHLHPDRGGSSYLASELNEAKKILLDRLS